VQQVFLFRSSCRGDDIVALELRLLPAVTHSRACDVVHVFPGGTIRMLTDVVIDPAGHIWAANNWNNP
jgi:hypothetical protein